MIRKANSGDFEAIASIYNYYILHTHSTFETEAIDSLEMGSRITRVQQDFKLPWLVIEDAGTVVGYAYATQWKARQAYAKTTESSVYIEKNHFGKGYGKLVYQELMTQLESLGYHAIIGGISLPNEGSIRLHESLGFKKIGEFEEVGFKFERWINVGYWELILR